MYSIISYLSKAKLEKDYSHFLLKDPRINWPEDQTFNLVVVLFSTDKSLCGGLNTNLFRGLESWLEKMPTTYNLPPKTKLHFISVGKKAKDYIIKSNKFLLAEFPQFGDKPHYQDIIPIANMIMDSFKAGEFQMTFISFMKFISTISQSLSVRQILPIQSAEIQANPKPLSSQKKEDYVDYLFEPNPKQLFSDLLTQYIELSLYHVLLESLASEHSARMVAMKNANENALEIVNQLTLEYNQLRQAKITGELLDVISARKAIE